MHPAEPKRQLGVTVAVVPQLHLTCTQLGWWIFLKIAISVRKSPSAISSDRFSTLAAT